MKRKPLLMVLGGLAGLVVLLGAYKYWRVSAMIAQAAAFPEPAESVEVASVREVEFQPSASATGTVLAKRFVTLSNRVAGPVESVEFKSGQLVKQGQVLLRLNSGGERAELKSALADIELAQLTVERKRRLVEQRAGSQAELDRAIAEREQAEARAAVLRERIEDRLIRAPFAGRVGLRDVHPGQYLAEGTELTTLESLSNDVDVDFRLPQEVTAQLSVGNIVTLSGGTLTAPAPAKIIAIDARADETSRNVRVRAEGTGLGEQLKPGSFVDVQAKVGAARKALAVPLSAVRRAAYGDHVFLVGEPKNGDKGPRAMQRFVRTGAVVAQDIVVLQGLALGDRVAATGAFKLRENALVNVTAAGGAKAADAQAAAPANDPSKAEAANERT
jgi:membrane fusion protein (multidrug efflux system)